MKGENGDNMKFRPCIDIHNGKIKQIVGSSLKDQCDNATENFVSEQDGKYYASLYKKYQLKGGHIIILNSKDSMFYEDTKKQAIEALNQYPGGLQIGGGIDLDNAKYFLDNGASHVIVTSYVFKDGKINYENLKNISQVTGKDKLVLDLSCRKKDGKYYIVTDRWQKFTNQEIDYGLFNEMSNYCDEFLIHAVDVEGKNSGIDEDLITRISNWEKTPITYAGGIRSFEDIDLLEKSSNGSLDYTIGSALDIFGGKLKFLDIVNKNNS